MKCTATFPWTKEPCPNDAEFKSGYCWECMDEKRELQREAEGRDWEDGICSG